MALAVNNIKTMAIQIHRTIPSFRLFRKTIPQGVTIGFVPTMGALHEGHLSLVREARSKNDIVIASIYVNPTQFGKGEDLDKYPRTLERDTELLNDCGVDHLFAPEGSMYGLNHVTYVDPMGFDDIPEGKSRPGHFRGVATVVTKLFNIVQPTNAYFGQKDAAQCALIRKITSDLDIDVNINIIPTMRESDGLAMSSRNVYLSKDERIVAPILYKSLYAAKEYFDDNNNKHINSNTLQTIVMNILKSEPLVNSIQYVSIDCKETMQPLNYVDANGAIISIACKIGNVRLIDNIVL